MNQLILEALLDRLDELETSWISTLFAGSRPGRWLRSSPNCGVVPDA